MVLEKSLPMTAGDSECSYANNSILQRTVIVKSKPILEESVKNMLKNGIFPKCFTVADLGCSSGPNTLLSISNVIDTVHNLCKENKCQPPEFQVYLNDLPDNDFNSVFKTIPSFLEKMKKQKYGNCYIAGVAGSFYERLFPRNSLNFVQSSYSLHWLSQVPKGLECNKGSILISESSPPQVVEAYFKQFDKDFSTFLHFRSQEVISGGHMVLVYVGRRNPDPRSYESCCLMDLLTNSLLHLAVEVPKGLECNKGSILISESSPPQVVEAYLKQFDKNFSSFLHFRSQEVISGGHMVLVYVGRRNADPRSYESCCLMDLLTNSLLHLAAEGKIKRDEVDSFNMPSYAPYEEEIKKIIQMEGSFTLETLEAFESDLATIDKPNGQHFEDSAKLVVKTIRAVTEVMLASHFGNSIIDHLFHIYIKHVTEYLSLGNKIKFFNISLCLKKK